MIVAVTGRPPGRDAVDQLAPIRQHDAAALRADDRQRRPHRLHLRIGQPDVLQSRPVPVVLNPWAPYYKRQTCRHSMNSRTRSSPNWRAHLRRALAETERIDGIWVVRAGRRLLSFSCNDYLGLTQHPALKAAAIAAIERHGVGVGASRLVTGNHPLYTELEARLARLNGADAACVFGSGYLINSGVTPGARRTRGPGADRRTGAFQPVDRRAAFAAPTSIRSATTISSHVEALLDGYRARHRRALIVTEGVFSMDGDRAPLAELAELAARLETWLIADEPTIWSSAPPRAPASRCGSARCRRRSARMAVMSRPRSRPSI